jgi:hypothetical protein
MLFTEPWSPSTDDLRTAKTKVRKGHLFEPCIAEHGEMQIAKPILAKVVA